MASEPDPALKAVSDAVLAVASQRSVEDVLQELVERARELAGATYAALGLPDGAGGFARFLVSGMSDGLIARLGPLPRTHGMLGAMLETAQPYRTHDIHGHPRFRGWWPNGHPDMHAFLGVPITDARGEIMGAFYLTDKPGGFTDADVELIRLLASHAAIAITNARLYERSRELSTLAERNRLALELHDVVAQKLFGLVLAAGSARALIARGEHAQAGDQAARLEQLAREAHEELRGLIHELRPPELEQDGLAGAIRKHVDVVRRVHEEVDIELSLDGEPRGDEREVLRIVQEALHNALRHANPHAVRVRIESEAIEVSDDGAGFVPDDPELRSRHLGLTAMEERAERLGGRLTITSAPNRGTTVRLDLAAA